MFTATYLENNENYEDAIKIYPYLTDSQLVVLRQTEDVNIAKETAESVIKRNKYIPIAYDALATISQYTGDFDKAVEYKIMSLNATKFELAEYIDYFNVLKTGYEYYTKTENNRKVEQYKQKILDIPDMINSILTEVNPLAKKINVTPDLTLPDEVQEYINSLN